MKRRIYVFIAVMVYIIMVSIGISTYVPSGNLKFNVIARDGQGNIYGVKSEKFFLDIYKMDLEGKPLDYFRCRTEKSEVESFCRYSGDTLYVGQIWFENGVQVFSVWKKGDNERNFRRIWKKSTDTAMQISDFYVENGSMYVLGISTESKDIVVYSNDTVNSRTYKLSVNFFPVSAKWGEGGVYTLSQDNNIYYIDLLGDKTELGIDEAVILMTDESGYYYRKQGLEGLTYVYYNGRGEQTYKDLGDVWFAISSEKAQNVAMMTYYDDEDVLVIVDQDGTILRFVEEFNLELAKNIRECIVPVLVMTTIYIALLLLIYLFKKLVWNRKKLRYQTIGFVAVVSAVWLLSITLILYVFETTNEEEDRGEYTYICQSIQKGRLENEAGITGFNYEKYKGSIQQQKIEKLFEYNIIGDAWQKYYITQEIIYGYDNPVFVYSDAAAYGRHVDTYYSADTVNAIKECIKQGEEVNLTDYVSERNYVISIVPVGNYNQQLCLLVRSPLEAGEKTHGNLTKLYVEFIVGWVVLLIILGLFLQRKWNFIGTIMNRMDRVSKGDYKSDDRKIPDNELGGIWTMIERMCKSIQMQRYKQIDTLDYVNQFAPKNFERLFGKERLQDIEVGETIQIPATMGIISIIDRDTLLTGKLQHQYVQYVNQLMEILFSQEDSDHAVFLQNGSNLENMKVIFKNENGSSAVIAAKYSIDCIETLLGLTETKYDTKPFILLHTSTYSCGVAGGSMQVYPFVTSTELETLGTYIEQLKNCGVRMVATESTWQEIKQYVKSRYIGYVENYRLYEILDACSQTQALGRLKNIEKFEKALELFYSNKLYEARNMFSDIVKECPDDGIARWYTFACDELFNRPDSTDTHYELFWTKF